MKKIYMNFEVENYTEDNSTIFDEYGIEEELTEKQFCKLLEMQIKKETETEDVEISDIICQNCDFVKDMYISDCKEEDGVEYNPENINVKYTGIDIFSFSKENFEDAIKQLVLNKEIDLLKSFVEDNAKYYDKKDDTALSKKAVEIAKANEIELSI